MTDTNTTPQFRLTIIHDDDSEHLNPNEQDSPLFKLHSFSNRHLSFTDPDVLLACQYEFPEGHENEGYQCDEMPTLHDGVRITDHSWVGPEGYMLSYFEHGQCKWFLASSSNTNIPDFQWDGVMYAGYLEVVVPEDEREWWNNRPEEDKTAAAESFCEEYTYWCNGDAYGYSLEKIGGKTCELGFFHEEVGEEDSCFGFLGFDWFQQEVRLVTGWMGATEENTEVVDEAYGIADYGNFFTGHFWDRDDTTQIVSCQNCGLLPAEPADYETKCEGSTA